MSALTCTNSGRAVRYSTATSPPGRCAQRQPAPLDVTDAGAGAKAKVAACTGAATQKWAIAQTSANDFGSISNIGLSCSHSRMDLPRARRDNPRESSVLI